MSKKYLLLAILMTLSIFVQAQSKRKKSKQKATVYSPKLGTNIEANISFTITVSDSFKVIEKLIPPNCLCGPEDNIPGLAGKKLPSNLGILYSQI